MDRETNLAMKQRATERLLALAAAYRRFPSGGAPLMIAHVGKYWDAHDDMIGKATTYRRRDLIDALTSACFVRDKRNKWRLDFVLFDAMQEASAKHRRAMQYLHG